MPIFDEPGKGRKQCQNCKKYVGVRSAVCDACQTAFPGMTAKPQQAPEPFTDKGPGKGRKQCPNCKVYVGIRSAECPSCHSPFKTKESTENDEQENDAPVAVQPVQTPQKAAEPPAQPRDTAYHSYHGEVLTPAGKCPVQLTGTDPEIIQQWASEVRQTFRKDGKRLADEGLRYYVHHFYDFRSPEYKLVIAELEK